ncbi:MAG: squalene synthase HpnC [Myxococcales bacterium]|nr:squalene synthase HpnC [Myxococcales bacterium]
MAREHYENFPVASRFVPAHLRPHVWAIYAFARQADDFADEPRYAGRRQEALADWEDKLEACFHGEADHPIFVALRETVERRDLPISPLRDLLTAFRMDLAVQRYPTFEALRSYCAHSAHPVGRLVLYVFDYRDANLHRYADDLCTALQLTNFLQDIGRDLARGRIYIPGEDLSHFGVTEADLAAGKVTPAFHDLMRFQVARARSLFERGRPLAEKVGRDLGFELHLIWRGGMTILDKIEAVGYDVFRRRPELTRADKLSMVARSAARRWPTFSLGAQRI